MTGFNKSDTTHSLVLNAKQASFDKLKFFEPKAWKSLTIEMITNFNNMENLGIWQIDNNFLKKQNVDDWNDALDLSPSYYQYLKFLDKSELKEAKPTNYREKDSIENIIGSIDQNWKGFLVYRESLENEEYKKHPINIILDGWVRSLFDKKIDFEKYKDDRFMQSLLWHLDRSLKFYRIAFKNMHDAYTKENPQIEPLLYRHCARLYEFVGDIIFVLLAYNNEKHKEIINLDNYQDIMWLGNTYDPLFKNYTLSLKATDYPATSGCDAFLKTMIALKDSNNLVEKRNDYFIKEMSDALYFEIIPFAKNDSIENLKIYYLDFCGSGIKGDDETNKGIINKILNELELHNTRWRSKANEFLEKNSPKEDPNKERDYFNLSKQQQLGKNVPKAVVVIDTTLIDKNDQFVKDTMKKFYKYAMAGSLIIIEAKSLQKFAQLGNGKLKLGNIRVIQSMGSYDNADSLHKKFSEYANETLVGSRDEIAMMLFMTEANPRSENIFVNKVKENVVRFSGERGAKNRIFFANLNNEEEKIIDNIIPRNYTFGFSWTTQSSPRLSIGLEPGVLIDHYKGMIAEEVKNNEINIMTSSLKIQ